MFMFGDVYLLFLKMYHGMFFQVFENQLVPLTRDYLAFEDADTPDKKLVYTVTTSLAPSEGSLEHVNHPYTSLLTFTQDDINNNRIVYRPPDSGIDTEEMVVSFSFVGEQR